MAFPAVSHGATVDLPVANGVVPVGLFTTAIAAGSAYASSTTPTNVEGTLSNFVGFTGTAGTIPAGHLNAIGKAFRVKAGGIVGNTVTPNLTLAFLLGTTAVATTGAVATATITGTSRFDFEATCVVTGTGASGTVMSFGRFSYYSTAPVVVSWGVANATPGTADTVDLTAAQACHFQATWGTSSASNTLTCTNFTVEFLN